MQIENELDAEQSDLAAKQATLDSLLQTGASSAQQNAELEANIQAQHQEVKEAEAKKTAMEAFAQEP